MKAKNSTESLIESVRDGDRGAFESLTRGFRQRLVGLIHTRLGESLRSKVDIDDVVQETLLRAFRSIDRYQHRDDTPLDSSGDNLVKRLDRRLAQSFGEIGGDLGQALERRP